MAVDPVRDGAFKVPFRRILDDELFSTCIVGKSLTPANSNPGISIGWVGLKVMLPLFAIHVDSHKGDVGATEVQEGRLALGMMAEHNGMHEGRRQLGLGRDFIATLALLYGIVS